ncbi:S1C family serine protease [Roseiconus lacunae]|uniref:Trypsin-like peptidase domain-containing protein n=1 Tax=Roseiconus lacunae TaxID=2605694 RepID=A0ABT7PI10_9BACT|nr:trypsin-like peptidase domain-containing protein [Roseiconus lacunae]MDM4016130.1 trypsin-like peptidase domain-containing protein [Roseiconus lacunae]
MATSRNPKQAAGWKIAIAICCFAAGTSVAAEPLELPSEIEAIENARVEAVERAMPSAVCVFVPGGGGGGSGVLISPEGYALTNFHVTSPAGTFMRCGLSDGRVYDAVLVGLDPVGDLAMIKLLGRDDFPVATMADSLKARAGDWCMVIGNPFLLATNLQPTVTWGLLSGVGRYQYPSGTLLEYADCLQTDASINPGNSGGPIYNDRGELLGIVGRCSFEKRGRVNVGVGYAISINQAKNFLGYLQSGRIVDHATLGATVSTDSDGSVVVSNILESSDAYRRGLRYDSEILEIDGRVVTSANDVQNVLGTLPSGWRVEVAFREAGKTSRVPIRLMGVHRRDELLTKMQAALPPPPPVPDQPEDETPEGNGDSKEENAKESDDQPKEEDAPKSEKQSPKRTKRSPHGASAIPAQAAKLIDERKGFANYHFNQVHQDRIQALLRSQFPAEIATAEQTQRWLITGTNSDGGDVVLEVGNDGLAMTTGGTRMTASNAAELFEAVDRDAIGGILAALDAWRRMIELGTTQFGEAYYQGTMPLAGQRPLRDCLVGLYGEMEVRWLLHPETGQLECIEVFADRDSDPAELWIESNGSTINRLDLKYGLESKLTVEIDDWKREEVATP